jgi:hypothetical protein
MHKKYKLYSILSIIILLILSLSFIILKITNPFHSDQKDTSWISDLDYLEEEIHELKFDTNGCPTIPILIDSEEYPLYFDTGCAPGITLTNLLENKVEYDILGQTEQLNRDGSHRGWSKTIRLSEFTIYNQRYENVETVIADWDMFSSKKFYGLIGLKYFQNNVITLDYGNNLIALSDRQIPYNTIDSSDYIILPLIKTKQNGQGDLLFFEAILDGEPICIYLDTGKNHSYIHNAESTYTPGTARSKATKRDVNILLDNMELSLENLYEVKLAQNYDLPYPITIELNSDIIKRNNLLVTIDLIDQRIIFRR